MSILKPRCSCGIHHLGFRAAGGECARHGKPEVELEPLGVVPGYRVGLARTEYLSKLELTGADFERMLNDLTPCEECGSGTHVTEACGLRYASACSTEDMEVILASAAVAGQTFQQVVGDHDPHVYAEVLRQARFGGLPAPVGSHLPGEPDEAY